MPTDTAVNSAAFDAASYDGLKAVYINCTPKKSPEISHTQGLMDTRLDEVWPLIEAANIVVIGGPIWLGDNSSMTRMLIERLYAMGDEFNENGQYVYYGKVGGAIFTGNEDAVKHSAMSVLYSLQHITFMSWNLMHMASILGNAGGIPAYGNSRSDWNAGEGFGLDANPEYR
ncbi:multimeric flavodoxin WrbA [Rhodoglobus vestalii]|uniref:Multimeric flavodoxin WrbA n=1 Tax=Rhodoglobus vestalii TaxID=193384 RepID=A0A8H2K756_9MICO|nr:flavodoxin family protein [Rhodoglobus vestalii]TQO20097.1 multimeric flavodoxin WrbA [Rhodoglobus vestalii]